LGLELRWAIAFASPGLEGLRSLYIRSEVDSVGMPYCIVQSWLSLISMAGKPQEGFNDPFIDDEAVEGEEDGKDEDGDTLMNTP
jgi:hypothetical protein